jgi:type II secretory pathway component PulF
MDKAYTFTAKNRSKEMMSGVVYAGDPELAYIKLTKLGYQPSEHPKLSLSYTLQNMMSTGFDRKELARFYASMAKRLKNGRSVPEGLDNAVEFVDDPRLKQALVMMKQFVQEGNSLAGAMKLSGFPMRDVEVIRSTAEAGKSPESMDRIAKEIVRADALRKSIISVLRMPMVICFIMYVAVYMMLVFIAPAMSKFFKTALTNVKLPAFAQGFYDFAAFFKANIYVGTAIYIGLLAGVVWFIRSPMFQKLTDHIKLVRKISERSDQANLWTSFSMLYDAGINTETSTKMLAEAAVRPESRASFLTMHRLLRSGSKIADAVPKSGFPIYIVRGVQAAESGGELVLGLDDMCKDLAQDIEEYTAKLKDFISLASISILSLFVLIFFMLSYYPILSSTLSQI